MGEFIILSLKVLMQISSKFIYFGLPEECMSILILLKLPNLLSNLGWSVLETNFNRSGKQVPYFTTAVGLGRRFSEYTPSLLVGTFR